MSIYRAKVLKEINGDCRHVIRNSLRGSVLREGILNSYYGQAVESWLGYG